MEKKIFIERKAIFTKKTIEMIGDLLKIIPNSEEVLCETKETMEDYEKLASSNGINNVTNLGDINDDKITVSIVEDVGPQFIVFRTKTHQFVFKIIDYKSILDVAGEDTIKKENSQLVLTNFVSDLGMTVAELFMSIFPINVESNQVVNFKVHKDFIFFRMYRFSIREKGPVMKMIGPQLTLRLWRMTEYLGENKKTHNYRKYVKNSNIL